MADDAEHVAAAAADAADSGRTYDHQTDGEPSRDSVALSQSHTQNSIVLRDAVLENKTHHKLGHVASVQLHLSVVIMAQ